MKDWIIRTFTDRNEQPEPRSNTELTETARNRIAQITAQYVERTHISETYSEYLTKKGTGVNYFDTRNSGPAFESNFRFIAEEEHFEVVEYLEILINVAWSDEHLDRHELLAMNRKINDALIDEGVLWKLTPTVDEVLDLMKSQHRASKPDYLPKHDGQFRFEQLADETVEEIDREVQVLLQGNKWQESLKPYNEAWDAYQQGPPYSAAIAEKLYNALENVLQQICVEQGWENDQQTVGTYFDRIADEGLLDTNSKMIGEWQKIISGIRVGVQKTGGDRRNWHENMEENYCLLLMHQTAAFLTFLIRQYEEEYE
jgi:hypothetical protein